MTGGIVLFAAAEVFDPLKKVTEGDGFNRRDVLIVISIGVVLGALLFVWAYFRYRKEDGIDDRDTEEAESEPTQSTSESGEPERRRRRKRRRRREHRPRNPSLQQTGGLPPPRPDDQLPKE